jgi:hypothetical protein
MAESETITLRCANSVILGRAVNELMRAQVFPFAVTGPMTAGTHLLDVPSRAWAERLAEADGIVIDSDD